MLGNGSDELISLLAMACDVPGNTILAPLPGFVMYEMSARLQGLAFVGVPLTAGFELDEAAMLAAIERHRPAITYIAYPNNPTANLFDDRVDRPHRCCRRRAGRAGGVRRGLPAVLVAHLDAAHGRSRACAGDAHAQQVRPRRRAPGLPGRRRGADRRDRQGAPALQRQRAQCRGDAVRARARRRVRAPGGDAARGARPPAAGAGAAAGRDARSPARRT